MQPLEPENIDKAFLQAYLSRKEHEKNLKKKRLAYANKQELKEKNKKIYQELKKNAVHGTNCIYNRLSLLKCLIHYIILPFNAVVLNFKFDFIVMKSEYA